MSIDSLDTNRQVLRLSGLSSGIDTESVVKSLLSIEQSRIDKQFQMQTKLEWKRDAYRQINLDIKNFREKYMSVLTPETNMLSEAAYNVKDITMLDETYAVSISAAASAETGTMTIDSITQLAEEASVSSVGAFSGDTMYTDTRLADLSLATPLQFDAEEISFSINGETFVFNEDTTIGDLINTVNSNTDANVKISFSSLTKGFKLKSKDTGSDSEIALVNISGNAFAASDSALRIAEGTYTGQDAMLSIEGINVVRDSNTFTIDGITYSLKNTSAASVSFNVARDIDKTVDLISDFVDSYNTLIGGLQSKIDEDVYRSYPPMTNDERAALSESEAEKWDEMSKSGLLRGDSYVSSLLNSMRSAFYTQVSAIGKSASNIGLCTGSYYDNGKITINKETLRTALENNPDEVADLFIQTSAAEDPAEKFNESGLVSRISNALLSYTDLTVSSSIANLETQISKAENRMDVLADRYVDKEEALWARFTAMETALATMNSQSSWLASMFAGNEN